MLIPINFTFYVTIFVLMIDKTIILMPILLSIITLFCHCLCAFAIMDRFEATWPKWIAKVFKVLPFCWITKLFRKSIDAYYIWYNVVWALSCFSPHFTILALPIDGYSKYSTKEILLVYAYVLMAYSSIIIYYLSFLYQKDQNNREDRKNSDLVDRAADRSRIGKIFYNRL